MLLYVTNKNVSEKGFVFTTNSMTIKTISERI